MGFEIVTISEKWNESIKKFYRESNERMGVSRKFTDFVLKADLLNPYETYTQLNHQMFLCIDDNQSLIGMVCVKPSEGKDNLEVSRLSVHPNFRRQGIARKLMEHCFQLGPIVLSCIEKNEEAIKFYQSIPQIIEDKRETRWSNTDQLYYTLVYYKTKRD